MCRVSVRMPEFTCINRVILESVLVRNVKNPIYCGPRCSNTLSGVQNSSFLFFQKILLIIKKITSVSITAPFITMLRPLLWIKLHFRPVLTVITERNKVDRKTGSSSTEDAALCLFSPSGSYIKDIKCTDYCHSGWRRQRDACREKNHAVQPGVKQEQSDILSK